VPGCTEIGLECTNHTLTSRAETLGSSASALHPFTPLNPFPKMRVTSLPKMRVTSLPKMRVRAAALTFHSQKLQSDPLARMLPTAIGVGISENARAYWVTAPSCTRAASFETERMKERAFSEGVSSTSNRG
jgi:hypothetical protein